MNSFHGLQTQGKPDGLVQKYRAVKSGAIGIGINCNAGDLALDVNANRSLLNLKGLSFMGFIQIRPFYKKILLQERPNFRIQLLEKRILAGIGLRRDLFLGNGQGLYFTGGIAASKGIYPGTARLPDSYFFPQLGLGWFCSLAGPLHFRIGYEFSGLSRANPHRLYTGLELNFLRRL